MKRGNLIYYAAGAIPVIWLALLTAPYLSGGLKSVIINLSKAVDDPFDITFCGDSLKAVLFFISVYIICIAVYLSSRKNYRRREEYGSAEWGNASQINKAYSDRSFSENKIMTENIRVSLDVRKHYRNLNALVIGGSGAGKTRFYAKPNIMQCSASYIVLDPKGEIVRDTGNLLMKKGYTLDLINM